MWEQICCCPGVEPLDICSVINHVLLNHWRDLPIGLRERIIRLDSLATRTALQVVDLAYTSIVDFSPLSVLTNLRELVFGPSEQLSDLSFLAPLINLRELAIYGCSNLTDVSPLSKLVNLTELNLAGCTSLLDLSPLKSLTRLAELVLTDCTGVVDLAPITTLKNLQLLIVVRCTQLRSNRVLDELVNRGVEVRRP